ncbi:BamA/TamA family outer membrane protein [filamentous cyanobacterium LEGE 11480]|uniref:BamA/TamA family outer membrane protein n=1 Tax=Romeriopsis navalis LEGE 11480 TaxID=2777977 RepID=A0A928VRS3_9CYAN|nr:ShlB/FhaC/HecB family hemolysin secretion/activation protein [Romeriopsis navalis]MBE9032562.1 BamA/TamA family outer membrane protein [Romeriopsis navalis LEGE 11480]
MKPRILFIPISILLVWQPAVAQTINLPRDRTPSEKTIEVTPPTIPTASPPLPTPPIIRPPTSKPGKDIEFRTTGFIIQGSQIFNQTEIDQLVQTTLCQRQLRRRVLLREQERQTQLQTCLTQAPKIDARSYRFGDVIAIRDAITESYIQKGYITTGAYIPTQEFGPQEPVQINVIEGELESIEIQGNPRLNSGYIRSRIAQAAKPPLNRNRLIQDLQLLRLNPLISQLSATLSSGTQPGKSRLNLSIQEAPTFQSQINLNNRRSPSIGSFERSIQLAENNLLGLGDRLSAGYDNTQGNNRFNIAYQIPITPSNTTLSLDYGSINSSIVEAPANLLDITSRSRYYELSLRHPIQQTPNNAFEIGLTFSHRRSQTFVGLDDVGAFPLSFDADDQGRINVSALRFFQDWTQRSSREVYALRSQFSLGVPSFGATQNQDRADSTFFSWRGQAQYVRVLGDNPDRLLLLRTDLQLSDRPLLSFEQFGIGGSERGRGYRQDTLLADNGIFASAEMRLPIARFKQWNSKLSLTPFIDIGHGWNRNRADPELSTLFSGGFGLRWQTGDRLTATLEYGIPFTRRSDNRRTLQENGLYLSVLWQPF